MFKLFVIVFVFVFFPSQKNRRKFGNRKTTSSSKVYFASSSNWYQSNFSVFAI